MIFIEIEDKLINLDNVSYITSSRSPYDKNIIMCTKINFTDGSYIGCDKTYYNKLKNYLKPIKFCRDDKEIFSE